MCLLDRSSEIEQTEYSFISKGTNFTNSMKSKQKMKINNSTVCSPICFSISLFYMALHMISDCLLTSNEPLSRIIADT